MISNRALRRLLLGAAAGAALLAIPADAPHAGGGRYLADLILSGLPERSSETYGRLRHLAGAAEMQPLEMTGSELWRVPTARLQVIRKAAKTAGIDVHRVDRKSDALMLATMAHAPAMTAAQASMMAAAKRSMGVMGATMLKAPPPAVAEMMITAGTDAGAGQPATAHHLKIPLHDRETVTLRRTGLHKVGDAFIWHGVVEGTGQNVTFKWWSSGRIAGVIRHKGRIYAIRHLGGEMHASLEIAPNMLPQEHAAAPAGMLQEMRLGEDPLVMQGDASRLRGTAPRTPATAPPVSPDADVVITVAVAYTRAAAASYTDIRKDAIELAVAEANLSFKNSGIERVRLELVHTYETDYAESGTHFDHVWRFADSGDGVMEEIHGVRERHHADVAVLMVHDPRGCGLSTRVAADADEAFAVVHHECAVNTYSLAHEIGHLIGARHDVALDRNDSPFSYGHGLVTPRWRTMMAYKDACNGCPRVPFWSNPDIRFSGVPTGNDWANNAKVIREQAARVAAFRGAGSSIVRRNADPDTADR